MALPETTAARLANVSSHPPVERFRVAFDDDHVLHADAELVGHDLGENRLVPLSLRSQPRIDVDLACYWVDLDVAPLVRALVPVPSM